MAARLGYSYNGYNPAASVSMEEKVYIGMSGIYPKEAVIDSATWWQIHDYIISQAPDSIPYDSTRKNRNAALEQFAASTISLENSNLTGITNIHFESETKQVMVGSANGKSFTWPESVGSELQFQSPVISRHQKGDKLYVTEIGYMNPSENPRGTIYRIQNEKMDTLAQKLHRPVFTEVVDLDGDNTDEILICEFGNHTGELSMLVQKGAQFEKRILLPVPGTINLEIADMNLDGKKDIVVLASQGNEGVYILYQEEDLQFRPEQVLRFGPEHGSSWFQLMDYNGDEHLDIVLANGDNADYSIFLKPYHGVRLFINDGQNEFSEEWFYPIYGATRVQCEDYDLDGDLDIAVMAFFPDFENAQEESFVWLENRNAANYDFVPHTHPKAKSGRWMVMESADFDRDGDLDIILGSFLLPIDRRKYKSVIDLWMTERADLLLLENKAIK